MILLKYCSLRLWMNLEIKISLVWALFFFIFSQMLAAFSDANFARIPHAAHFISAAALVRVGLDPLSWKKEKKKQSINCRSVRGGGCFLLVQHTNHKSKTKQNNMKTIWSENIIHFIEVRQQTFMSIPFYSYVRSRHFRILTSASLYLNEFFFNDFFHFGSMCDDENCLC